MSRCKQTVRVRWEAFRKADGERDDAAMALTRAELDAEDANRRVATLRRDLRQADRRHRERLAALLDALQ